MTLAELQRETLAEKNTRLRQEKCRHPEIWSSTFWCDGVTSTNRICLECGWSERSEAFIKSGPQPRNLRRNS